MWISFSHVIKINDFLVYNLIIIPINSIWRRVELKYNHAVIRLGNKKKIIINN